MLIDTRDHRPEPEPEPRRRRPDLSELKPFLPFGEALALVIIASYLAPVLAYVLIVAACALMGRGLGNLLGMGADGMKEHRQ